MSLQAVLAEIHPDWYCSSNAGISHARAPDACVQGADMIDADLLPQARGSVLGRRLLSRWLMANSGSALLAPRPGGAMAATVLRWPRARLDLLIRDLGALAFAPAIRGEVLREPVRRLKRALGNGYLLALDKQVWNGRVEASIAVQLQADLGTAVGATADDSAIHALLDRRGRSELQSWAAQHDPALAEWSALQHPREAAFAALLPEKQVLFLHDHHLARDSAS